MQYIYVWTDIYMLLYVILYKYTYHIHLHVYIFVTRVWIHVKELVSVEEDKECDRTFVKLEYSPESAGMSKGGMNRGYLYVSTFMVSLCMY